MPQAKRPPTDEKPVDSPTAWFAVLEQARAIGQSDLIEKATRELKRLGVEVHFADREVSHA